MDADFLSDEERVEQTLTMDVSDSADSSIENAFGFAREAEALAVAGHVEAAINKLSAAIAADPGVADYHTMMGLLLARMQLIDEAAAAFESAVGHAPLVTRNYVLAAAMYEAHGQHYDAAQWLRRAVAVQSNDVETRFQLASLLARSGWPDRAEVELTKIVRRDPDNAAAYYELSCIQTRIGLINEAAASAANSVALAPGNEAYERHQRVVEAIRADDGLIKAPAERLAVSIVRVVSETVAALPKCIVYTNFLELNPDFGQHHLRDVYVDRVVELRPVSVCRMPARTKLYVPSFEDFLPVVDRYVAAEQVSPHWGEAHLRAAIKQCQVVGRLDGPVLLVARFGINTWGHWLGELLPRIVAAEHHWPGRFRYIVPDSVSALPGLKTVIQSIEYYGITQDRLAIVRPGVCYDVSKLHIASPTWSFGKMHPAIAQLMRKEAFRRHARADGADRIALFRRKGGARRIENSDEVEVFFAGQGWHIVDLEEMSFANQVNLFRNAREVVSVLGSGMSGLLYSPKGVKVLSLAPSGWGDSFFYSMMQHRDAKLADVRGKSVAEDQGKVHSASFSVDISKIEAGLAALDRA